MATASRSLLSLSLFVVSIGPNDEILLHRLDFCRPVCLFVPLLPFPSSAHATVVAVTATNASAATFVLVCIVDHTTAYDSR